MTWNELMDQMNEHIVPFLQGLAAAMLVVIVVFVAHRLLARGLKHLLSQRKMPDPVILIVLKLLRYTAIAVGVLLVLQCFDVLQNAWAALTAILAMVAIGFVAVWSVLSNTLCSVILLISRPFGVGDVIELTPDGLRGKVVNFNLLYTTLRTESGEETVQVPNNLFFQRAIKRKEGKAHIGLDEQLEVEADAKV